MQSERFYTFIISNHADVKPIRISLSHKSLLLIGACCLLAVFGAGLATYHYGRMLLKVADYNHLISENDRFRADNQNYQIQTAQLGEKIDFLETTARKLMIVSGMNSRDSQGGLGGFSRDSFSKPLSPTAGSLQSIDSYNKTLGPLENRYGELNRHINDKVLLQAATPSILPVKGYVTGGLGPRGDPFNGTTTDMHTGLDISAPYGSRVVAPADGTVIFAGQRAGYGNIVVIDHKFGMVTRYGHLWKFNVQPGQHVSRNDVIGYVGTTGRSTGAHLHFELWVYNHPVNPLRYIQDLKQFGM